MSLNIRISDRLKRIEITRGMWILIVLMLLGIASAFVRFANGIGAISDLSNRFPWGFWISFDLYCGVALGAGAFVVAGIARTHAPPQPGSERLRIDPEGRPARAQSLDATRHRHAHHRIVQLRRGEQFLNAAFQQVRWRRNRIAELRGGQHQTFD